MSRSVLISVGVAFTVAVMFGGTINSMSTSMSQSEGTPTAATPEATPAATPMSGDSVSIQCFTVCNPDPIDLDEGEYRFTFSCNGDAELDQASLTLTSLSGGSELVVLNGDEPFEGSKNLAVSADRYAIDVECSTRWEVEIEAVP